MSGTTAAGYVTSHHQLPCGSSIQLSSWQGDLQITLQHTTCIEWCRVLQCVRSQSICWRKAQNQRLQQTAAHTTTVQHTATNCNALLRYDTHCNCSTLPDTCSRTATHCITLPYAATHYTTLHHTAPHCTT